MPTPTSKYSTSNESSDSFDPVLDYPCEIFDPERLYSPSASELRQIATVGTLAQWRHRGFGPNYTRVGSGIRYYGRVLNQWLDSRVVRPRH